MTRAELIIWAAGFLDGEGCISVGRSQKGKPSVSYTMQTTAFQNVRDPLDILSSLFGGTVRRREKGWWWQLGGRGQIKALQELLPFLVVKRAQAQVAIIFQSRKTTRGSKYADPVAARALDHRDWQQLHELKLAKEA